MKALERGRRRVGAMGALGWAIGASSVHAWAPAIPARRASLPGASIANQRQPLRGNSALAAIASKEEGDAGSGAVEDDWREFRAHLVQSESDDDTNAPSKRPDKEKGEEHWAFETGDFVERGSIVVSVPSSDAFLNDVDALNNICYRKSIVLVLDVGPNFIQGIVLNRPTNIGVREGMQFVQPGHGEVYEDELGACLGENCDVDEGGEIHSAARWKVWFGGEVGGPYSDYPQVMCLHSVASESAAAVSDVVLPGIFVTSFDGAQSIVRKGDADPSDFWLFCGICGWETSTFYREMHEEGLWHIVSADSGTILEELNMLRCEEEEEAAAVQNCDIDQYPENAGLHTWEMLMENIGLEREAHESEDSFGDLMLHEWATGALSFSVKEEQTSMIAHPFAGSGLADDGSEFDLSDYDPASAMSSEGDVLEPRQPLVGVMVRASSAKRSPYLLSDQGFHKSLILILRDDDDYSEGVMLNHVTSRTLQLDLGDETVDLPIRYGGPTHYYYADGEEDDDLDIPSVFLHSSDLLRDAGIGTPVGKSRLLRCTEEEVIKVLKAGFVSANEFMCVQGFSMWTKRGEHTGVLGDVESGFFELVRRPIVRDIWSTLLPQKQLTEETLSTNVATSRKAWNLASRDAMNANAKDEIHVFGTGVDVATLADEAQLRWVKPGSVLEDSIAKKASQDSRHRVVAHSFQGPSSADRQLSLCSASAAKMSSVTGKLVSLLRTMFMYASPRFFCMEGCPAYCAPSQELASSSQAADSAIECNTCCCPCCPSSLRARSKRKVDRETR
ncbi:hypothetical protein ACHAXT_008178 [Thalassiosira profunda]